MCRLSPLASFYFIIIIVIIIIIIIIVVVVVVHDDTNYWVYLSSDHLFQVYYKVRQVLLQSATAFLLQSATSVITKCNRYYKVWQCYYKVRQVLQSGTIITKCDSTDCSQSMRIAVANTLPVIGSNCRSVWVFSFCIQKIQISNVRFNVRTVCLKRIIVPFIPIFPVRNKTSSIQLACSRLVWFLMCLAFRFLDACKEAF